MIQDSILIVGWFNGMQEQNQAASEGVQYCKVGLPEQVTSYGV